MIVTQEYIDNSIQKGKEIYNDVIEQAKKDGYIGIMWVSRVFNVNWHTAAYIVNRMEDENICERFKGESMRKIL